MWAPATEELEAHVDRLLELGQTVDRLDPQTALRHEPDLIVPPGVETVYRFPGEGWVQTGPVIAALLDRGRAAGLRLLSGTDARAYEFGDVAVSCLGRWTGSVLGAAVPMLGPDQPGVAGLVARTTEARSRIGGVVVADGLLIRPEPGGRLLLTSETVAPTAPAATLLEMLRRRVRGTDAARIDDAWVCVRAIPADRLPVIGWARDGLYVVATHSGVTLAPALAELVGTELLDGTDRSELTRFRPDRFRSVVT